MMMWDLDMKKIYAFGDSNTYGFDPRMGGVGRYPKDIRWTGEFFD